MDYVHPPSLTLETPNLPMGTPTASTTNASTSSFVCYHAKEYAAMPFKELRKQFPTIPGCGVAAAAANAAATASPLKDRCCRKTSIPSCPVQAIPSSTENVLLLLPVCMECLEAAAAAGACHPSACKAFERPCRSDVSRCVCSTCLSSVLLLLLLRLGMQGLLSAATAASTPGVLLCSHDDVPDKQRHFLPCLLGSEDVWPWCDDTRREKQQEQADVNLTSHREAFLSLSRLGYKRIPRPDAFAFSSHPENKCNTSTARLPQLLRHIAQLPQALNSAPTLLLLLQPSRWLITNGRSTGSAIQHVDERRRYGLFLALLLRQTAFMGQQRDVSLGSVGGRLCAKTSAPLDNNFFSTSYVEGDTPGEGQGHPAHPPACSVVAEVFATCKKYCFHCSPYLPVNTRGYVSLCCFEQSEWLSMLRSRFTHIYLVFYGYLGQQLQSKEMGGPQKAPILYVADVTNEYNTSHSIT